MIMIIIFKKDQTLNPTKKILERNETFKYGY